MLHKYNQFFYHCTQNRQNFSQSPQKLAIFAVSFGADAKKYQKIIKKICRLKILPYLCTRNTATGCSAVRLAHLVWDQRVPGSNPGIPTERDKRLSLFFCCKNRFGEFFCTSRQRAKCSHTLSMLRFCSFASHKNNLIIDDF